MKETDDSRPVRELEPPPTAPRPVAEEPTILARWLFSAYKQGPIFWVMLVGLAVILLGAGTLVTKLSAAKSEAGQAWIDLLPASKAEDQLKVADAHPKTRVAEWARLQAAFEEYRAGLDDLTASTSGRRESAGPRLKRALDLFTQVAQEAPKESPQSRGAALAVARVLEARNELPEAIKQYRAVADEYKGTPEARQAEALARRLESPESIQFYKDLYTAKLPSTPPPPASPLDSLKGLLDIAPPPTVAPGGKPADLLAPGTSGAGKSFLPPSMSAPQGIDAPPPSSTPTPAPAPAGEKPAEAPKAEAAPAKPAAEPAANPPK